MLDKIKIKKGSALPPTCSKELALPSAGRSKICSLFRDVELACSCTEGPRKGFSAFFNGCRPNRP